MVGGVLRSLCGGKCLCNRVIRDCIPKIATLFVLRKAIRGASVVIIIQVTKVGYFQMVRIPLRCGWHVERRLAVAKPRFNNAINLIL